MSAEDTFWNPDRSRVPQPVAAVTPTIERAVSDDLEPSAIEETVDEDSSEEESDASESEESDASPQAGPASLVATANKKLLQELANDLEKESKRSAFAIGGFIPILDPDVAGSHASEGGQTTSKLGSIHSDKDIPTSNQVILRWDSKSENTSSTNRITFPLTGATDDTLAKLVSDCEPAGFGRGNTDVFDETYRKAGKLDTTSFCIDFSPYNLGIIDSISRLLLPALSGEKITRSVRAELYKLNVYSGPSGKFKPHVDTPRSASQFGSLVVCLPCSHDGGQLVVRHANDSVVFDWSTEEAANSIAWAAFYSDCEHEVLEVTKGHRITLTYNLYVASTDIPKTLLAALDPTSLPLYAKIRDLLAQPGFMQEGGLLGFYCAHAYAHTSATMINHLPWGLKGIDMTAYQAFKAAGLEVESRPVVNGDPTSELEDYEIFSLFGLRWNWQRWGDSWAWINNHKSKSTPKSATKQDIADRAKFLARYHEMHPGKGAVFVGDKFRKMAIVEHGGSDGDSLGEIYRQGLRRTEFLKIEWLNKSRNLQPAVVHLTYGNEAGLGTIYTAAALIFRVPPFAKRQNAIPEQE